ncbi:hypothetical protein ZWY2020_051784 [Hordeum vulgare]|nr:hypothetical protein ZWY2020_051784 [Hordeum vulgare]
MEPLALNQNPGQFLPRPEVMPLPNRLFARAEEGGDSEYVRRWRSCRRRWWCSRSRATPSPRPSPAARTSSQRGAHHVARDQGDFYRTRARRAPAKPSSPYQKRTLIRDTLGNWLSIL